MRRLSGTAGTASTCHCLTCDQIWQQKPTGLVGQCLPVWTSDDWGSRAACDTLVETRCIQSHSKADTIHSQSVPFGDNLVLFDFFLLFKRNIYLEWWPHPPNSHFVYFVFTYACHLLFILHAKAHMEVGRELVGFSSFDHVDNKD